MQQKISLIIIEEKSFEKLLSRLKRACNKNNELWKKRNDTLTKKEEKMHNKKKVCHICKKRFSTVDGKKKTLKQNTIVIILENTAVLLMTSAI